MPQIPIYNCFHPILKKKTSPVTELNQAIKDLIYDMFESMYKADGIGLAANQVGSLDSIIIIDTSVEEEKKTPIALINPNIISYSDSETEYKEGCLSIPTLFENVVRPDAIEVEYMDLNMKQHKSQFGGLAARVIQHEVDHLNGILFVERLSSLKRSLISSKLRKIQRNQIPLKYPMIDPKGNLINP